MGKKKNKNGKILNPLRQKPIRTVFPLKKSKVITPPESTEGFKIKL